MKTKLRIPPHDLPPRGIVDKSLIDTKYWSQNCEAATHAKDQGYELGPNGGFRADVIGIRHPETGKFGHMPTPETLRDNVIQATDDWYRFKSNTRRIPGGNFDLDWDTWIEYVPRKPGPRKPDAGGNTPSKRVTNAAYSQRQRTNRRNRYSRGT
jgi:hypothetical protein